MILFCSLPHHSLNPHKMNQKKIAAIYMAEQRMAQRYDRGQFKISPDIVSITLHHEDGSKARLNINEVVEFTTARHKLFGKILKRVQRHLRWERERLRI